MKRSCSCWTNITQKIHQAKCHSFSQGRFQFPVHFSQVFYHGIFFFFFYWHSEYLHYQEHQLYTSLWGKVGKLVSLLCQGRGNQTTVKTKGLISALQTKRLMWTLCPISNSKERVLLYTLRLDRWCVGCRELATQENNVVTF